jgi:hypothetical protein
MIGGTPVSEDFSGKASGKGSQEAGRGGGWFGASGVGLFLLTDKPCFFRMNRRSPAFDAEDFAIP